MTSLRSRLILGSALVAVVPLAVAMFLLAHRIEAMVRTEAAQRLNAALEGLVIQNAAEGERITEKLGILGRDPTLKRLYLVQPADRRDLSEYLAERRFLLGLDFLQVADTSGTVVADGRMAPSLTASSDAGARQVGPVQRRASYGLAIESLEDAPGLALAATAPIPYQNQVAGIVHGGLVFDAGYLGRLKRTTGMDLVLRGDGRSVAATLGGADPLRLPLHGGVERVELA